jgi:hypothetical protein
MSDRHTFETRAVVAMQQPGGFTRLQHVRERPGHWQDVPTESIPSNLRALGMSVVVRWAALAHGPVDSADDVREKVGQSIWVEPA